MSQKRTQATTAYIMKMNPYMKVLALNPEEGAEAFPMFQQELLVSSYSQYWTVLVRVARQCVVRGGATPLVSRRKQSSIDSGIIFIFQTSPL